MLMTFELRSLTTHALAHAAQVIITKPTHLCSVQHLSHVAQRHAAAAAVHRQQHAALSQRPGCLVGLKCGPAVWQGPSGSAGPGLLAAAPAWPHA